jgi:hypothetical protein
MSVKPPVVANPRPVIRRSVCFRPINQIDSPAACVPTRDVLNGSHEVPRRPLSNFRSLIRVCLAEGGDRCLSLLDRRARGAGSRRPLCGIHCGHRAHASHHPTQPRSRLRLRGELNSPFRPIQSTLNNALAFSVCRSGSASR